MPGITNVSVQSKGAYGSLQEATVSFIAWDIRQLEDLELLYMRPGYTVLLEFGWSFVNPMPKYDILNRSNISLNDAFKDIYKLIQDSNGNYDALLGYVKNYNWSAREDGGYDCTATIISLGEVLESLKVNWIPMETIAFSKRGLLGYGDKVGNSYEQGIIPGLIHELFYYMDQDAKPRKDSTSYSRVFSDPTFIGTTYNLYMTKRFGDSSKMDRGGLPKYLGSARVEGYITLGSLCKLINNYVLLKNENDTPISQITTSEMDNSGNITNVPLKCAASPLSLSTNYGICFVRNDNWKSLGVQSLNSEAAKDAAATAAIVATIPPDILQAVDKRDLIPLKLSRIQNKIQPVSNTTVYTPAGPGAAGVVNSITYKYAGSIETDITKIADDLAKAIINVGIKKENQLKPQFIIKGLQRDHVFVSNLSEFYTYVNFFDYFDKVNSEYYIDLFGGDYASIQDNTKLWTKAEITDVINKAFTKYELSEILKTQIQAQLNTVTNFISNIAPNTPGLTSETLQFLVSDVDSNNKSLGYLENIYVNMDFLYEQAISKNVASNDTQNKNVISIRNYIQNVLRNIQNSLGNVNNFDLQVDNRNAIGRIIDINYTGNPLIQPFTIQLHNLSSIVRKYEFSSKIFPEMGSIIAISAQDPTGIGKLGYDNATLVAWNNGIQDRLIPKKNFSSLISTKDPLSPSSFLLPFLTKIYAYFTSLSGKGAPNDNFVYGGLDYAYRDFLANLDRYDPQNAFKAIIPTELTITMDGIGGIIIGNIFQINQDIVPKGYKSVPGRNLGYIVTKLGHNVESNDWTTTLQAYPVILETAPTNNVWKQWNNNEYPNNSVTITTGGTNITLRGFNSDARKDTSGFNTNNIKTAVQFFTNQGFKDYQIAAIIGGLLQESRLDPSLGNSTNGPYGIAQWLKDRLTNLKKFKNGWNNLNTQLEFIINELNTNEKAAGDKLKSSVTLEEAVAAASAYERFKGINNGSATTYQDVLFASETGSRIGYAKDILERIKKGEFK